MAAKSGKSLYLGALLLLLAGIGYLAISGFANSTLYEMTVANIATASPDKQQAARLSGKVTKTENTTVAGNPAVRFLIEDEINKENALWVLYRGSVPDTFKAGSEVIIEGGYDKNSQEFNAKKLMTKCPSKYEQKLNG